MTSSPVLRPSGGEAPGAVLSKLSGLPIFGERSGVYEFEVLDGGAASSRYWCEFSGGRLVGWAEGSHSSTQLVVKGTMGELLLSPRPQYREAVTPEQRVTAYDEGVAGFVGLLPTGREASSLGDRMPVHPGISVLALWLMVDASSGVVPYWQVISDGQLAGAGFDNVDDPNIVIACPISTALRYLTRPSTFLEVLGEGMVNSDISGISRYSSCIEGRGYRDLVTFYSRFARFWIDQTVASRDPRHSQLVSSV